MTNRKNWKICSRVGVQRIEQVWRFEINHQQLCLNLGNGKSVQSPCYHHLLLLRYLFRLLHPQKPLLTRGHRKTSSSYAILYLRESIDIASRDSSCCIMTNWLPYCKSLGEWNTSSIYILLIYSYSDLAIISNRDGKCIASIQIADTKLMSSDGVKHSLSIHDIWLWSHLRSYVSGEVCLVFFRKSSF